MMGLSVASGNSTRRWGLALFLGSILSVTTNPLASAGSLEDGVKLFQAKKYKNAIPYFEQALRANPYDYNAIYYSALSYQYLGDFQRAKGEYGRLVDKFPYTTAGKNAQMVLQRLDPRYLESILRRNAGASPQQSGNVQTHGQAQTSQSADYASLPSEDRVRFNKSDTQGGRPHIIVAGWVNNRPVNFIFDTGAEDTTIGKDHLSQLGLKPPEGPPTGYSAGVGSSEKIKTWHMMATLKLGNIERKNMKISVLEKFGMNPLLGQDFFKDFQYTIDNGAQTIHFVKKGSSYAAQSGAGSERYAVPFTREGNEMVVNVDVDGRSIPMYFDTGASNVVFTNEHLKQLNIRVPEDAVETSTGGIGGQTKAKQFPVRRMRCGPIDKSPMEVTVVEAAAMRHPLLGQTFFHDWQYTIDNQNSIIRFVRR